PTYSTTPPPPRSTLFPYTTLFRSLPRRAHRRRDGPRARVAVRVRLLLDLGADRHHRGERGGRSGQQLRLDLPPGLRQLGVRAAQDRKSTRLNSSHVSISYAVFCLT